MMICIVAALTTPTLLRASVDGAVHGVGFTPYLPFVLLASLMLDWPVVAALAVASAGLGDYFFVGPQHELLETASDRFGAVVFAAASALAIGMGHALRKIAANSIRLSHTDRAAQGIVFSQEGGQVYASWYGGSAFVPLGSEAEVTKMMRDFLAQADVGRKLIAERSAQMINKGKS
jgi:hypothetical protein